MVKISKKILENVLEVYRPEYRYLAEATFNYPLLKGNFKIPHSVYSENSGHFNAVEMIICYNQLAYTFFVEAGKNGLIQETGKVPLEEFKRYQLKNSFMIGMNNIKFWKPINPKNFQGKVKLEKIIPKRDDLIFFKTSYDFEDGKATGNIDLAFLK